MKMILFTALFSLFSPLWGDGEREHWNRWTDEQIEEDFAPYQESGITLEMLDQTMEWNEQWKNVTFQSVNGGMVRFRIINSQIYQTEQKPYPGLLSIASVKILEQIIKKYSLPDLDFIYFNYDVPSSALQGGDGSVPLGPILASTKKESYQNFICFHDWISPLDPEDQPDPNLPTPGWGWANYSWKHAIKEVEEGVKEYPWEEKEPKLFWRGRPTEVTYTIKDYFTYPRAQLVMMGTRYPQLMDVAFTGWHTNRLLLTTLNFPRLTPLVAIRDHLKYKYQIALDGVAAQYPGFAWRLLSDCLVFKVEAPFKQWFEKGLVPGFHYLPIKRDLSDLLEKLAWVQEHDDEARRIAEHARQFALESIMPDDVIEYCYKVLLKYASLQRFQPSEPKTGFTLVSSPLEQEKL
jgi:hypothetical protein